MVGIGVFSDHTDRGPVFAELDQELDGALSQCCSEEDFTGKPGQQVIVSLPSKSAVRRVFIYGLGEQTSYTSEIARRFGGDLIRVANRTSAAAIVAHIPDDNSVEESSIQPIVALCEGVFLGNYRYTSYLSDKGRSPTVEHLHIASTQGGVNETAFHTGIQRVRACAQGVNLARDLVNMPPNDLVPSRLASEAEALATRHQLDCTILHAADLEREEMYLHLGVGQGSSHEPKLIHLTYTPKNKTSDRVIAFVGKGLTFDAGGLSLKPPDAMMTMKIDMGGAAAVLGAMEGIAVSQPGCIVHGIVGAAENMPDGAAIRPGDIITGKKGISVEILNTDAEGRLVLADALAYAQDQKPTEVINLATLTGACIVALGTNTAGAFIRDEDIYTRLKQAWEISGEKFWRMPLSLDLRENLESDVADIKNIGDRSGGAITAGLFLSEFVDQTVPWAHLDVAGPVFAAKARGYIPKGGTGFAVRTLVEYTHLDDHTA